VLVVFLRQEKRWDFAGLLQPGRRSQQQEQQWLHVVIVAAAAAAAAAAGVAFAVGVAKGSKEHSLVGVGVAAKKTLKHC